MWRMSIDTGTSPLEEARKAAAEILMALLDELEEYEGTDEAAHEEAHWVEIYPWLRG